MSQFHKDNHYVPQLYLKRWSKDGNIFTYRLLVPHENVPLWKEHSLRGIAFHQHLYTYLVGREETDEFERWLGQEFETPAEEAIRLAVNDERMSTEHWRALIRFVVAQDVRTPANLKAFLTRQRESLQALMSETLEDSVKRLEEIAKTGTGLPRQEAGSSNSFPLCVSITKGPDGKGSIETRTVVGRKLWLWSVRHLLTNTIEKITHSRWTIVRAPKGVSWPTTDNPVIKLNFQSAEKYDFGGGWGRTKCDIFFPLSPKHLLHNSIGQGSWPRGTVLEKPLATFIRKIIIEHADRYVFDEERSDVHLVRPRVVSVEEYKREQDAWSNWHREQSDAESSLSQ
ncbi:DUF4238 domain-containing protein [Burkholderia cenocepacia]|uniref:DUF4238 domain-containing protein n=1 Tax=Burkholderia cenocepacia TaxID=95486 RepID=UPI00163B3C22|nr:DUF4238 domain-containing protein [Burkholderia cenocepacia]